MVSMVSNEELMFLVRTILKLIFKNFKSILVSEKSLIYEYTKLNEKIDYLYNLKDLRKFEKELANFFDTYQYFFELNIFEERKEIKYLLKNLDKLANDLFIQLNDFKRKLKEIENNLNKASSTINSKELLIIFKECLNEVIEFIDYFSNELIDFKNKIKEINERAFKFEKKMLDLEKKAFIDKLTSVYNRRAFELKLNQYLADFEPGKNKFAIIFFDLDNFKQINDKYGHLAGDLILKKVAEIMKSSLREGDLVFRYGGDEFIVVIFNIEKEIAYKIAKRIIDKILNAKFLYKDNEIKVKISGGLYFVEKKESLEDIINKADQAMYLAKNKGTLLKIAN